MNKNMIKIVGITANVVGIAATLIGKWTDKRDQEEMITRKVAEALDKMTKGS